MELFDDFYCLIIKQGGGEKYEVYGQYFDSGILRVSARIIQRVRR